MERIKVTEQQLEIALMNRSGAYSTIGNKKNATFDYERIHERKTNWRLIKMHQKKIEDKEKEKERENREEDEGKQEHHK